MTLPYDGSGTLWLDDVFRVSMEQWANERAEFWNDQAKANDWSLADEIDKVALATLSGVEALVRPENLDGIAAALTRDGFVGIAGALKVDLLRRLVLEKLELSLAERYCSSPRWMAERTLELVELVLEHPPHPATAKYLSRLSQAFVMGLRAETVILCRAVLESVVRSWFVSHGEDPPETMGSRLEWLRLRRVLDPKDVRQARDVWHRGNVAVHEDPDVTTQVLDTVRDTLSIAAKLST